MKKVASCKNFLENFAYLKEKSLQILQHANFSKFFSILVKKIKANLANYEKFHKIFSHFKENGKRVFLHCL